ncbi:Auxin responsive SAUR protein [Corchorus olitorius]|uniref:Auxin responsive SAUR protein n=1 Tax=Corchorus olitorius TaxID=93759 RepID=A0A1R3KH01_9ROSI|nr:Auxin responsive SAUR protein [Corchorus olitorius]
MPFKKEIKEALQKTKRRDYHKHGLDSAINNLASKTTSLIKKTCRSGDLDKYYTYKRLAELQQHDHEYDDEDQDPTTYVPVYVGKEAKRYDVPAQYLSLPRFRQMMRQSQGRHDHNNLDTSNNRPIILSCSTEAFELLLELCSFKRD